MHGVTMKIFLDFVAPSTDDIYLFLLCWTIQSSALRVDS